jgi:hypothetical protein
MNIETLIIALVGLAAITLFIRVWDANTKRCPTASQSKAS